MKTIIVILLFTSTAFAKNYYPFGKVDAKTVYTKKSKCESVEGQKCFDISDKDIEELKIGFRSVDVLATVDCDDQPACEAKRDAGEFACGNEGELLSFDDKANWPLLDFTKDELGGDSGRLNTGWFLWCQKEELKIDDAKKAANDAAKAAAAADKATRDAAKAQRKTDKDACVAAVNGGGNLTAPQIKDCIEKLVKEVFENDIATGDL